MVRFLSNSSKKSLKQRLDFPDKKGLQLWSDLLNFEAETTVVFLRYKSVAIMVRLPSHSSQKYLEKIFGFLR